MAIPGLTNAPQILSLDNFSPTPGITIPKGNTGLSYGGNNPTPPNNGSTYTIGGQTYNQYGDPITSPTTSVAPSVLPTSIAPTVPAPVYAPNFNTAAVAAKARADAAGAVNPLYTAKLNDFLASQAALRQQHEQQAATDKQNAADTLKEVQDANALTGERTTASTTLKEADINKATDQYQQDSGDQFALAREAQARAQAVSGTLGSGAGNRQSNTAIITRNTTEGRAVDKAQEQKDAAELFKAQTFEDLTNNSNLAAKTEGKNVAQTNFDLNNYITNLGFQTEASKNALEEERQNKIDAETQALAKTAYNNYINGIANPAQRVAAAQIYGGSF